MIQDGQNKYIIMSGEEILEKLNKRAQEDDLSRNALKMIYKLGAEVANRGLRIIELENELAKVGGAFDSRLYSPK